MSFSRCLRPPCSSPTVSTAAVAMLVVCYVCCLVSVGQCQPMMTPLVCRDVDYNSSPVLQKVCMAVKAMAETNQFTDDYYKAAKLLSRAEAADSGNKRMDEPNHVFLRFGRRR